MQHCEIFIKTDDGKQNQDKIRTVSNIFYSLLLAFTGTLPKHTLPVFRPHSDVNSRCQHIHSITHIAKVARFRQQGSKFFTLYSSKSPEFAAFIIIKLLWSA